MRIPLDYYRILGVPVQVTQEQLSQAYRDRLLQLPRLEYSDRAISARKQLLETAFQLLFDAQQRAYYDAQLLALEPQTEGANRGANPVESLAEIEIEPAQLVGALLILQELGEYELVLKLGEPHLRQLDCGWAVSAGSALAGRSTADSSLQPTPFQDREDIILTIALACLELARERWQQREYESAAASGKKGLDLLKQESLFPSMQEEIQTDLHKLRPYRTLELLAQPDQQVVQRYQGMQLLQEMLQQRNGIDGKGEDYSGLSVDDFLRFIQQLRGYLTAAEQQELFEAEAQRPSAVGTYLAVYALIARGFAYRKPSLLVRAQAMLKRLTKWQDVNLEQAVCSLLLGQTEEATSALEHSQERESIAFIREQSKHSPDLLPGLCQYAQRWLQTEVFAHFRDLTGREVSLEEYFADEAVQAYLEQLPAKAKLQEPSLTAESEQKPMLQVIEKEVQSQPTTAYSQASPKPNLVRAAVGETNWGAPRETASGTLTLDREEIGTSYDREHLPVDFSMAQLPQLAHRQELSSKSSTLSPGYWRRRKKQALQPFPQAKSLLLLAVTVLLGLSVFGLSHYLFQREPQLAIKLNESPIPIPPLDASEQIASASTLNNEQARQAIATWLAAKAKAFGPQHQLEQLSSILAPPLLSLWRGQAEAFKGSNTHREFQHSVEVIAVRPEPQNANRASVEARVREVAQHYQNGQPDPRQSYDDNLQVRYDLVRQQDKWLIEEITVLQ